MCVCVCNVFVTCLHMHLHDNKHVMAAMYLQ